MHWAEIDAYVAERQAKGRLAPSSAVVVRSVLRTLERHSGVRARELTELHLQLWLIDGDPRPSTVRSRLSKARAFVRWLVRKGVLEADISDDLEAPRVPEAPPRCLDPEQAQAVLAACPDARARLVVMLMLQVGLRVGEVARIVAGDIDYRRRVLSVRGKGGRGLVTRTEPITEEAWLALVEYGAGSSVWAGHLIRSMHDPLQGVTPAHLSRMVARWFWAAGVKASAYDGKSGHACRHTCAQDISDAGAHPRIVQRVLGHRDPRTSEIYLRRDPPDLRKAMEGRWYGRGEVVVPIRWGRRASDRLEQQVG